LYVEEDDSLLVCGGRMCVENDDCQNDLCLTWNPVDGWVDASPLISGRDTHVMANGPNLDIGTNGLTPIILGNGTRSTNHH